MGNIEIKRFVLGSVGTNCYLVWNKDTKEAVIVDPADHASKLQQELESHQLTLKAVLLTHGHFDHIMATNDLCRTYTVPVYCHKEEVELLEDATKNLSAYMGDSGAFTMTASHLVEDNEKLELLGQTIEVLHTPGHTKGGVCYYFVQENCMFVGDTIFLESVGRTDFPTGNMNVLLQSIQSKIYSKHNEICLYPGHGPATSIGYEKENNPYTTM